ncbi:MAG: hypothetical protein ABI861_01610 [Panacibacter sp.]
MTTAAIREKLQEYIRVADNKKLKAIYTILESEIEGETEWWKKEAFIDQLDKEYDLFKNGDTKGYSLAEVEASVQELKAKRKHK